MTIGKLLNLRNVAKKSTMILRIVNSHSEQQIINVHHWIFHWFSLMICGSLWLYCVMALFRIKYSGEGFWPKSGILYLGGGNTCNFRLGIDFEDFDGWVWVSGLMFPSAVVRIGLLCPRGRMVVICIYAEAILRQYYFWPSPWTPC